MSSDINFREQIKQLRLLAKVALSRYNLNITKTKFLSHGENTNFAIHAHATQSSEDLIRNPQLSQEVYLLRIHRPYYHDYSSISSELIWLKHLQQEATLTFPKAMSTKCGLQISIASTSQIPQNRYCVLFHWISGRALLRQPLWEAGISQRWSQTTLEKLGKYVAKLHQLSEIFIPPPGFVRPQWDWEGILGRGKVFQAGSSNSALCTKWDVHRKVSWIDELKQTLIPKSKWVFIDRILEKTHSDLKYSRFSEGIIHADLHLRNFIIHRGQISAIDFDDCGWGYYIYDIAIVLFWLQHNPNFIKLAEAFFRGYLFIRSIQEQELLHLNTFFALRGLYLLRWVIERSNISKIRKLAPILVNEVTKHMVARSIDVARITAEK